MEMINPDQSHEKLNALIAQILDPSIKEDTLSEQLESYIARKWLTSLTKNDLVPIDDWLSVSVASNQSSTYTFATGVLSLVDQKPVECDTLYNIASVTKFVMVNLLCRLIDQQILSIHDTIADHLDIDIPNAEQITIETLVTHTSGLIDNISYYCRSQPIDNILSWNNCIAPNIKFIYANVNFVILALIFESVTKDTLYTALDKQIFTPLQLKNTTSIKQQNPNRCHSIGYKYVEQLNKLIPASDFHIWGASHIRSTPSDLVTMMHHFFSDETYISKASRLRVLDSIKPINFQYFDEHGMLKSQPVHMGYALEQQTVTSSNHTHQIFCASGWQDSNLCFVGFEPATHKTFAITCTQTQGLSQC